MPSAVNYQRFILFRRVERKGLHPTVDRPLRLWISSVAGLCGQREDVGINDAEDVPRVSIEVLPGASHVVLVAFVEEAPIREAGSRSRPG